MSDLPLYLNFVLALAFVLGLIGVAAWMARRFGLAGRLAHRAGPSHRLAVVEVMPQDTRRKLVLLRRDESEYLVLLGSVAGRAEPYFNARADAHSTGEKQVLATAAYEVLVAGGRRQARVGLQ